MNKCEACGGPIPPLREVGHTVRHGKDGKPEVVVLGPHGKVVHTCDVKAVQRRIAEAQARRSLPSSS